ncbi:MAG: hypothetical protein P9E24_02880 [Candidatus Competibacter sp.]|nr:hypothetical protein [Candidatus Competibacter sp.]MDG4583624.1 hypothetical protein [Candidatus Competibacter sp.]
MLNEVFIEQAILRLVDGTSGLGGQFLEPDPDQEGTADRTDARLSALTAFQPSNLFAFAAQLLDLPTKATHLLSGLRGILSGIVGHDPVRAVGSRHRNPEQARLVVFGKAFDLGPLLLMSALAWPLYWRRTGSMAKEVFLSGTVSSKMTWP